MSALRRAATSGPRSWLVPVLLVVLAVLSVAVHVPKNAALSPLDEYVYADYVYKLPEQWVVTQGESTGPEARSVLACEGTRGIPGGPETTCAEASDAPDSAFVMGGATSADIYTPLYFLTSWTLAQPLTWAGVEIFDAVSAVGAFWLSLGVLFLYAALRRLGVPRGLGFVAGLLYMATPPVFWASTYVSTDAPALAVGSAVLWSLVRVLQTDRGHVALVLVSVLGVLFKVQNVAVVGLAALALVLGALLRGRADASSEILVTRSKAVVTAVVAVVASVAAQGAWLAVRAQLSSGPSPDQGTEVPLTTRDLVFESLKFLSGTASDPTGRINGIPFTAAGVIVGWVSVLGVLGCVLLLRRDRLVTPVAWATLVAALVVGPLLVLGVTAVTGYYFELPTRYGLPLLPAFLACAAVLAGSRPRASVVLVPVALVLFGATVVTS